MEKKVDYEKVERAGMRVIRLLDSMDLNMTEQLIVADALLDAMKKAAVAMVILGDNAKEFVEMLVKQEASKAVEEAERIMDGEE